MSERKRRRSRSRGSGDGGGDGGSERRTWRTRGVMIAAWFVVLFLVLNLAVSWFRRDDQGRFSGLVTEKGVAAFALWAPLALMTGAAIAGALASWKSWQRSERASSLWMLRGFIVSLFIAVALAIGTFELDRRWFAVLAACLFAAQTTLFATVAMRSRSGSHDHAHEDAADDTGEIAADTASDAERAAEA